MRRLGLKWLCVTAAFTLLAGLAVGCGDDDGTTCTPTNEACNGIDDDCDGLTDEDLTRDCVEGGISGTQECINGQWGQ